MDTKKIFCPDIGDFEEVDVIEILVKEGQTVDIETPLVTLESDKATMDVPSPLAGRIDRILVKIGNKVSKLSLIHISEPTILLIIASEVFC